MNFFIMTLFLYHFINSSVPMYISAVECNQSTSIYFVSWTVLAWTVVTAYFVSLTTVSAVGYFQSISNEHLIPFHFIRWAFSLRSATASLSVQCLLGNPCMDSCKKLTASYTVFVSLTTVSA